MKVTYVLNGSTGILHRRLGGKSYESCNLDQIKQRRNFSKYPETGVRRQCLRCHKTDIPNETA